jgi:hypothetical protein
VATVGKIFLWCESTAELDGSAEEGEVIMGDVDAMNLLRNGTGEVKSRAAEVVSSDVLENTRLPLPIVKFGNRSAGVISIGLGGEELHYSIGVRIGKRLK